MVFHQTIISDIASAIRQDHGIAVVLSATAQAFDHHTTNVHDSDIGSGIIMSLLHALDHVCRKIRVSQSPLGSSNEAKTLLIAAAAAVSTLEMITSRCSSEVLGQFVQRNCNDLFLSLANLLTIFAAGDNQSSVVRKLLLQKITNTLAALAASSTNLTDTEIDPQVIFQCCSALSVVLQNEGAGQARSNCIAVLLNFSRSTDQVRGNMLLSTGLFDTLISLIRLDSAVWTSRRIEEDAMSILHNLSASAGNSICMASNEEFQLLLVDLMTESTSSSFIIGTATLILRNLFDNLIESSRSESPNSSRQRASKAFLNLSWIAGNEQFFASCANLSGLFSCLNSFASSDDTYVCENAIEAIYNLCNGAKGLCFAICSDNNIPSLLFNVISGEIEVSDAAYSYCIKAIKCLASHPPNQKRLSKYRTVVPNLITVAAMGPCSPETKEAAIEAIVLLSRTAILI